MIKRNVDFTEFLIQIGASKAILMLISSIEIKIRIEKIPISAHYVYYMFVQIISFISWAIACKVIYKF